MMSANLLVFIWRKGRRISVIILGTSLVLCALWTWAILENNHRLLSEDGHATNSYGTSDKNYRHAYLLQKLISQANRVLKTQQLQPHQPHNINNNNNDPRLNGAFVIPAAAHTSAAARGGNVIRFLKPSKGPTILIQEASAQSISLVARRKKASKNVEVSLFEDERLKILENQQRSRQANMDDLNTNMDYERSMLSSAERLTQYQRELQAMGVPVIAGIGPDTPHPPNERLVHLDLKGAPPKLSFLKHLLPMLKALGATGLLIEYEDMFPFTNALAPISAKNAYKPDELQDFLETVALHGLSVMPLIQTFGHMEYVLKLEEYQQLREMVENPQSLCSSKQESHALIQQMLTQVIEYHLRLSNYSVGDSRMPQAEQPLNFTHIHIGCDEVFRMAECNACRQRQRNELFLTHVTTIANFVRQRWPQLKVVIWDDMLRDMTLSEMQHSHIGNYVEPMIWVYANDIYHFIQPQLWDMYAKVFPTAWAASAFKGAFGESLMIPPIQRHLENNIRWLAVIAKEGGRFAKGFKGLALTGWQRYDHFAILCELLPTAIPSLITSLSTVSKGFFNTNPKENNILRVLECGFHADSRRSGHAWLELHPNSHHSQLFSICQYPGHQFYKFALRLFEKVTEAQNYLQQVHDRSAWLSDYNLRHNFSSPLRVHALAEHTLMLVSELSTMSREAYQLLFDMFDEHTIAEFIEQQIYPTISALQRHLGTAETLLSRRVWPQRPLPYARELNNFNLLPNYHAPVGASRDGAASAAQNLN